MEKSWSLRLLKSIRMDKKLGLFRSLLGSSVDDGLKTREVAERLEGRLL